jgi:preprotein translocase subunit YajC
VIKHPKLNLVVIIAMLAGMLTLGGCVPAAGETPSNTGFDWSFIIMIAIFIVAIYFLMIRPQRNRQKQQQKLLDELGPGDQVLTSAGIYGEIESLDEKSVVLKIESGGKIRVSRMSIAGKRAQ